MTYFPQRELLLSIYRDSFLLLVPPLLLTKVLQFFTFHFPVIWPLFSTFSHFPLYIYKFHIAPHHIALPDIFPTLVDMGGGVFSSIVYRSLLNTVHYLDNFFVEKGGACTHVTELTAFCI